MDVHRDRVYPFCRWLSFKLCFFLLLLQIKKIKWSHLFLCIDFISISPSLADLFIPCSKNKNAASLTTQKKVKRHQQLSRLASYNSEDERARESASPSQIEWNVVFLWSRPECVAVEKLFRCGTTAEDVDGQWAANEHFRESGNRKQPLSPWRETVACKRRKLLFLDG